MAGWIKFTDGNCYSPAESPNECSPYNQQEFSNMSNDELTTFYNLCKINNPINCPSPKYTPPPINLIDINILEENKHKFQKDVDKYKRYLTVSLEQLYEDDNKGNISPTPESQSKVDEDKEIIDKIIGNDIMPVTPPPIASSQTPTQTPTPTPTPTPPPTQSSSYSTPSLITSPKLSSVKSTTPSSTPSSTNNYIMYIVIIIIVILLFICSLSFYFNKKKKINN